MGFLEFLNSTAFGSSESTRDTVAGLNKRAGNSIVPPPRSASSGVSTSDALSLAAVFRAVSILSTAIKQLSIHVYRDGVETTSTPIWIRQPDPKQTRAAFLEQTVNSMALSGNAFWRVYRNETRNEVVKLEVLNPFDVMIQSDDYGNLKNYVYRGTQTLSIADIQHLSMLRVPGNLYGLGPIQSAQKELLAITSTRDYVSEWFAAGGTPAGILKTDQMLDGADAQRAAEAWNALGSGKTAVLGNGLSFQSTYLSPKDAQFLETQSFGVEQISRLYGIPVNLMATAIQGGSMTYSNIEQELISFTRFTLASYYVEIEEAITNLLPGRLTNVAKMNIDALLRSDTLTRYQAHQIALDPNTGWLSKDEVRNIEGLAPNGAI
jgi:HK97 family phage portal protein